MKSNKVVTVSIAAYNMEKYIRKTLDSLLDERVIDDLEVLVVDDGGTDGTFAIAGEYAEKYPDSIFPIHKENGGYGSVLNYTIPRAKGKYFRVLDGDDWIKTENLYDWIQLLKVIDVDLIFSPYEKVLINRREKIFCDICRDMPTGEYNIQDIELGEAGRIFSAGVTFKTATLQSVPLKLEEHCLYTDDEYVSYTMPFIRSIYVYHLPLYQWRLGRPGQSSGVVALEKNSDDNKKVTMRIVKFWKSMPNEMNGALKAVENLLANKIVDLFVIYFRLDEEKSANFYEELLRECPDLLHLAMKMSELLNLYGKTRGLAYPLIRMYLKWIDKK